MAAAEDTYLPGGALQLETADDVNGWTGPSPPASLLSSGLS